MLLHLEAVKEKRLFLLAILHPMFCMIEKSMHICEGQKVLFFSVSPFRSFVISTKHCETDLALLCVGGGWGLKFILGEAD